MSEKYNDWTNYQTWLVFSWLTSKDRDCSYWTNKARDFDESDLSNQLRNAVKSEAPDLPGLYSDLLDSALSEVNWLEIARAFQEVAQPS